MTQPNPAVPVQLTVNEDQARAGSYATYEEAQAAVDLLSDREFPIAGIRIVGTDLRSVEVVTGRMTKGRAALLGLMSGGWFGLFVGVVIALFASGAWSSILPTAIVLGGLWGAVTGFLGHVATRGKRDFSSTGGFVARRYDVMVDRATVMEAARILGSGGPAPAPMPHADPSGPRTAGTPDGSTVAPRYGAMEDVPTPRRDEESDQRPS